MFYSERVQAVPDGSTGVGGTRADLGTRGAAANQKTPTGSLPRHYRSVAGAAAFYELTETTPWRWCCFYYRHFLLGYLFKSTFVQNDIQREQF